MTFEAWSLDPMLVDSISLPQLAAVPSLSCDGSKTTLDVRSPQYGESTAATSDILILQRKWNRLSVVCGVQNHVE